MLRNGRPRLYVTLLVASAGFVHGARAARRGEVTPGELRTFLTFNRLPARAFSAVWVPMQLGSLGGALATGAAVAVAGHPRTGRRIATVGAVAWLVAKAAKPFVRRGRPTAVVEMARVLGHEQTGLGYPSGHAAVATAVAVAAVPDLPPAWRAPVVVAAVLVGPARLYVGAHLPLDVAGGLALGLAVGTASRLLTDPA